MPAEAIPAVALVVAMFTVFMTAVGGAWVWSKMPDWTAHP